MDFNRITNNNSNYLSKFSVIDEQLEKRREMVRVIADQFADVVLPKADDNNAWFILAKRICHTILLNYGIVSIGDEQRALLSLFDCPGVYRSSLNNCEILVTYFKTDDSCATALLTNEDRLSINAIQLSREIIVDLVNRQKVNGIKLEMFFATVEENLKEVFNWQRQDQLDWTRPVVEANTNDELTVPNGLRALRLADNYEPNVDDPAGIDNPHDHQMSFDKI